MSKNETQSYYIIQTGFVQTFGFTIPILFPEFFSRLKVINTELEKRRIQALLIIHCKRQ